MESRRMGLFVSGVTAALLLGMTIAAGESLAATIVKVEERSIDPDTITIQRGDEVIWKARGPAAPPQFQVTPTSKGVPVRITEDGDFTATFVTPGEYRYVVPISRGDRGDLAIPGLITVK